MDKNQNEQHQKTKIILRIVGIVLLACGLALSIVGFANFGNFESDLFFCTFLGLPCAAFGIFLTISSFSQSIARYVKNEHAPIINELGNDIRPFVQTTASAVKEGVSEQDSIICSCGNRNEKDDKFCSSCGKPLHAVCPKCGKIVDINDKFCPECGEKLA